VIFQDLPCDLQAGGWRCLKKRLLGRFEENILQFSTRPDLALRWANSLVSNCGHKFIIVRPSYYFEETATNRRKNQLDWLLLLNERRQVNLTKKFKSNAEGYVR
jgi:hypothetical protein